MFFLATDLDRTLLPNGKQPYDGSMGLFRRISKNFPVVFVTGRKLSLVKKAISKYKIPLPNYAICDVGTTIYEVSKGKYVPDKEYERSILSSSKGWDVKKFKEELRTVKELKLQEGWVQKDLKLSYYVADFLNSDSIAKEVSGILKKKCNSVEVVYSFDEAKQTGLLDVLPKKATKLGALEYLRKKLGFKKKDVVYCGDSGNDVLPLTFGYRAILVRNALPEVRKQVRQTIKEKGIESFYEAKGWRSKNLNGYYVSGIIEGLIKTGLLEEEVLRTEVN